MTDNSPISGDGEVSDTQAELKVAIATLFVRQYGEGSVEEWEDSADCWLEGALEPALRQEAYAVRDQAEGAAAAEESDEDVTTLDEALYAAVDRVEDTVRMLIDEQFPDGAGEQWEDAVTAVIAAAQAHLGAVVAEIYEQAV